MNNNNSQIKSIYSIWITEHKFGLRKKKNLKLFKMNILIIWNDKPYVSASTWKFQVILIHCTILCECLSYCNPIQKYYKVPREVKSMTFFWNWLCIHDVHILFFFSSFSFYRTFSTKDNLGLQAPHLFI